MIGIDDIKTLCTPKIQGAVATPQSRMKFEVVILQTVRHGIVRKRGQSLVYTGDPIQRAHPYVSLLILQDPYDIVIRQAIPYKKGTEFSAAIVPAIQPGRGADPYFSLAVFQQAVDRIVAEAVPVAVVADMTDGACLFIQHIQTFIKSADPDPVPGIGQQTLDIVAAEKAFFAIIETEGFFFRIIAVEAGAIGRNPHISILIPDNGLDDIAF
jgi:hypothetical protein